MNATCDPRCGKVTRPFDGAHWFEDGEGHAMSGYFCTPACRDAGRALNPPSLEAGSTVEGMAKLGTNSPPPEAGPCWDCQAKAPSLEAGTPPCRMGIEQHYGACSRGTPRALCSRVSDGTTPARIMVCGCECHPDHSKPFPEPPAGTPTGSAAGIEWPPPLLEERPDSAAGSGDEARLTVREAARRRQPLGGPDAQALEGALQQVERDLAAALKREGEARRELEAVEGQRDAAIAGADVMARAAREARERAIEECAVVVEEFADETDSDPERLAVLSAALAVRALATPTAEAAKEP